MCVPVPFKWEHHQQKAFDELKHSLLKDGCLVHPVYSETFALEIDVSIYALGAVLSQETNKGELRPNLRWAVTVKFKDYLQCSQFRVLTYSNPL